VSLLLFNSGSDGATRIRQNKQTCIVSAEQLESEIVQLYSSN